MRKILWSLGTFACAIGLAAPRVVNWELMPGLAYDIGVSAKGDAWCIGIGPLNGPQGGGFGIFHYVNATWVQVDGSANRIAVAPDGSPWVTNDAHHIYRRENNAWTPVPGEAVDIGIGANGDVWIVGTEVRPDGYAVQRWTGKSWVDAGAGGWRIAVGPDGTPWVVDSGRHIHRQMGGIWQTLPGLATDIGVGPKGEVWITGADFNPVGGYHVYEWDEGHGEWNLQPGGAVSISVGPDDRPWATSSTTFIWHVAGQDGGEE
jgi:hypothetical protein